MGVSKTESIVMGAILDAMRRKRVTQLELADAIGLSRSSISIKFSKNRFTAKEIFRICDYLGLTVTVGEST